MVFTNSILALALLGGAQAHMIMNTPTPYNSATLQSSPLGPGIAFPCGGSMPSGAQTGGAKVSAGGSQKVAFTGSAVHGGGVCQFSVTYEYPPPADPKKWKVIHTIVGGCPAAAEGNVATIGQDAQQRPNGQQCGNGSGKECVRSFDIPIPKDIKNGQATFAWTWFNKIGNREMYMNCAPMEISGGSDSDAGLTSLPTLFVANAGSDTCATGQGLLDIPNPGTSVEKNETPSSGSIGTCKADNGKPDGSGAGSGSPAPSSSQAGSAPASSAVVSTPVGTAPAVTPTPTQGGIFAPGAGSSDEVTSYTTVFVTATAGAPAVSSAPAAPVESAPVAAPSGSPPASGGSGSGSAGKVACPTDGAIVCMSESKWGLCDHGFAVPQSVAAGTKCSQNKIVVRALPRRGLHRRHAHHFFSN